MCIYLCIIILLYTLDYWVFFDYINKSWMQLSMLGSERYPLAPFGANIEADEEPTIVFEVQHPRSMLKDYTMSKEFAQEKQKQGYKVKPLIFQEPKRVYSRGF